MPLWQGPFFATQQQEPCIQSDPYVFSVPLVGAEDCLYLNVYRPRSRPPGKKLSVVVFVHGGGWFAGGTNPANYGPKYFMETGDVILVSIAYRLSTLGFLATGDEASPGNYGLKDQTMALQWVRENIDRFGGDADSVTLFGHSAGSVSVQLHMVSPLSQGLFDASISASGTVFSPWAFVEPDPLYVAIRQAEAVGIENARLMTTNQLVERLRQVPAATLVTSVNSMKRWHQHQTIIYRPVIEPDLEGAFLLDDPRSLFVRGDIKRVPHMISIVEEEGINFGIYDPMHMQEFNARIDELLPFILEMEHTPSELNMTELVKTRYFPESRILRPYNDENWVQCLGERLIVHPFFRALPFIAANDEESPTYVYRFHYRGQNSYSTVFTKTPRDFGAVHLDDLIYLFDMPMYFPWGLNPRDMYAKEVLMNHYVHFIKDHDPGFDKCKVTDFDPICPYMFFDDHNQTGLMTKQMSTAWDMSMVKLWDLAGDVPIYSEHD